MSTFLVDYIQAIIIMKKIILGVFCALCSGLAATAQDIAAAARKPMPGYAENLAGQNFDPAGRWRGYFLAHNGAEIPFLFEIGKNGRAVFINAEERYDAGKVSVKGDSLYIAIDAFDNELAIRTGTGELGGYFRRQDGTGSPQAIKAEKTNKPRFPNAQAAPAGDISGTYDIAFQAAEGRTDKAVGLFHQEGNRLTATFLKVTGDSRYLEGVVDGDRFYLSSFIGSGPGYYTGTFAPDGRITGEAVGLRGSQAFTGSANEEAALPDPYALTFLKDGYTSLDFSFPDLNGKKVSLKDPKYRNKVVILTITGSWCPNCADEAAFLAPWYQANKKRGVEIIAIHYERQADQAYVSKVLGRFRQRFGIQYDQVFAGIADKQQVAASLPALNTFLSFPTTIFIDKKGKVARIHTGYSGPATGKYYTRFVEEFNEEVNNLLAQ